MEKILFEFENELRKEQESLPDNAVQAKLAIQSVRIAILKILNEDFSEFISK